ncbi:MAG: hypothetical protein GY737_24090 [Desulfobacteraceae bacterium]|nr:hypothetical protein [Desulfobacteraceae bacterium]
MRKIEEQRSAHLKQMVQIAVNSIEPLLAGYRAGEAGKKEILEKARNLVRRMTYRDNAGGNYIFMSAYDGTMLVQPFETEIEMTNQWDLNV